MSEEHQRELDDEQYLRVVMLATSRGMTGERIRAAMDRMGVTVPPYPGENRIAAHQWLAGRRAREGDN